MSENAGWGGVGGVFLFLEVVFLEDPSETKIQNHSHEICLEKLVCMLPRGDAPSGVGFGVRLILSSVNGVSP